METQPMRAGAGYTVGPLPIPQKRQVRQNLFRIFSPKAGMRVVVAESKLEADAIFMVEGMPQYTWLCEQPFRIDRPIGKKPFCTLDLAVRDVDGKETLYEIKPSDKLVERSDGYRAPPNWDEITSACDEFGRNVSFMTDEDIYEHETSIENWRFLLPFAVMGYEDPDAELSKQLVNLSSAGGIKLGDLVASEPTNPERVILSHIAMLLHKGELVADFTRRLHSGSALKGVAHEAQ
jgi:hypothetical protein